jgi:hypothetical protein
MSIDPTIERLPEHLRERSRFYSEQTRVETKSGGFVLYWMRNAVRMDENPALDVAKWIAAESHVPLLVYQAISEHYQFASDRHHTFMLQGARDVQRQLLNDNVSYAFHLANRDDRRPHLITLANMATVVVTEEMPVDPPRRFLDALKKKTETPIVCVDTACVAPMQLIDKAYTRAFEFRSATKQLYSERLTLDWPELALGTVPFDLNLLPFRPVDLQSANIAEMVASCEIDHSIGPVVDSVGGSWAGYRRWQEFRKNGLIRYARLRNDALVDGVSRMSPYLHYGMVSPMRIAREAAEIENEGAEKFLDELLIWRELAYAFCFQRQDHHRWSALPAWAQRTLTLHSDDQRPIIYSWEQLARGETHDQLWNAAQKSLLMQGELHNNVRMTWGKAILNWTRSPQQALETIIDLNHRYALDGRDPASYGGILWCLGQFDRPFEPAQKIIGTVRPRPTNGHANRLDPNKFLQKVSTPRFSPVPKVAVIGAGISGLFAARTLQDHGLQVAVFEKSRGCGGRMATRRTDDGICFDHGAQYFTVRDPRFTRFVNSWAEQGLVSKWPDENDGQDHRIVVIKDGRIESESVAQDRFVATPAMNSICKHLAEKLDVHLASPIARIRRLEGGAVELLNEGGITCGVFDRVVVSAPAAQAAALLVEFSELSRQIAEIEMNPCWSAMISFETPITNQWVGAFLHGSFLSWAARNSSKPGRSHQSEQVIIHAGSKWTKDNWERDPAEVTKLMLEEFWRVTGIEFRKHEFSTAHRWKYAIPVNPSESRCFADSTSVAFACGDWASGSRVEGAFLSGMAAAGKVLGTLSAATKGSRLPMDGRQGSFLFE